MINDRDSGATEKDGFLDVNAVSIEYQDAAIESLQETMTTVGKISDDELNQQMKNALANKTNAVLEMIDLGL